MAANVSAAMQAALAATITQPGWLLEVGANRYCSRRDINILGRFWARADLEVEALASHGSLSSGARIKLGDPDAAIVTLLLLDQFDGEACELWLFDAAATADDDPLFGFEGVVDAAEYDPENAVVQATLALEQRQPWPYLGAELGMSNAQPPGTQMRMGANIHIVERPR